MFNFEQIDFLSQRVKQLQFEKKQLQFEKNELQFEKNELTYEKNESKKNEQIIRTFTERKQRHINQLICTIEQNKQKIEELENDIKKLKMLSKLPPKCELKRSIDTSQTDGEWHTHKTPTVTELTTRQEKILHAKYERLKRYVENQSSQPTNHTTKTLKDLRNEMQTLSQKYMKAIYTRNTEDTTLYENHMEKIDEAIQSHPEFIEETEKKNHLWEEKNKGKNENAFHVMLDKIQHASTQQQKRRSKQLMILHKKTQDIAKLHITDLHKMVASGGQGLCITELRGIYHKLHSVVFKSDNDGSKKQWREMIQAKLQELTKCEENGQLSPHQKMNSVWTTETTFVPKKVVQERKPKNKAILFSMKDLLSKQLKKVS